MLTPKLKGLGGKRLTSAPSIQSGARGGEAEAAVVLSSSCNTQSVHHQSAWLDAMNEFLMVY